jgi:hypothetical protein
MGMIEWAALGVGVALTTWPILQVLGGRPQLSFAFDQVPEGAGCVLLVYLYNRPVDSYALEQMGVERDTAHFSVSVAILDESGNQLLKFSVPHPRDTDLHPPLFQIPAGRVPVTLRLVAGDAQTARIHPDAGPDASRHSLKTGTYTAHIVTLAAGRSPSVRRNFIVTQIPKSSYWADA